MEAIIWKHNQRSLEAIIRRRESRYYKRRQARSMRRLLISKFKSQNYSPSEIKEKLKTLRKERRSSARSSSAIDSNIKISILDESSEIPAVCGSINYSENSSYFSNISPPI